jgi:hypothetical protein
MQQKFNTHYLNGVKRFDVSYTPLNLNVIDTTDPWLLFWTFCSYILRYFRCCWNLYILYISGVSQWRCWAVAEWNIASSTRDSARCRRKLRGRREDLELYWRDRTKGTESTMRLSCMSRNIFNIFLKWFIFSIHLKSPVLACCTCGPENVRR